MPSTPQRIVSLVPSQTELLFSLGVGERVVGLTKFCIHPAEARQQKVIVGGTKQVRWEALEALQPDLIIGNKEENAQADIEALAARYPVWMSDIATLPDALAMIRAVGDLVGKPAPANTMTDQISAQFAGLPTTAQTQRVVYLIWRKPYMAVGPGTFIDDMLTRCGLVNAMTTPRYPTLSPEQLQALAPEVVLLSSEPYPFHRKDYWAEFAELLPQAGIEVVDGELFSWYGSRLLQAVPYFRQLRQRLGLG